MINEREKELLNGKMVESMRVSGRMENNMVWVYLLQKIIRLKEASGKMARKLNG